MGVGILKDGIKENLRKRERLSNGKVANILRI